MTEHVVVLGGAGFIGSSLALGLKQAHSDWRITCFDNLRRRGSELNLPRLRAKGIGFVHGDIRSPSDLDSGAGAPTIILDCSAEPSVLAGVSSPQYVVQTNLVGTTHMLEWARQTRARILFLSTSRVYPVPAIHSLKMIEKETRFLWDSQQSVPGVSSAGISEDFPLHGHRTLYGATKLASELLIEEYRQGYGLEAIINRCGVITGPWQMGKVDQGVFVLWMAAHYFQKKLSYIGYGGSGKQLRDALHVDDLLQLVLYELEHFTELNGATFNVGGGADFALSLVETTELCQQIAGRRITIEKVSEERPGDVPVFVTDSRRVMQRTGWRPVIPPAAALEQIHRWIAENEAILRPILA
jgi:CDP-paratose 2-epimerase